MNIRRFEIKDREELISLWRVVFPNEPPHNEPVAVLSAKLEVDNLIFVAEINRTIVGSCMAGYDGHRGWLYSVGVLEKYRRSGAGSALVKFAVSSLQEIGCIKVNLQIRSTNTEVAEFYKSLGFAIEDRLSMGVLI